MDLAMTTQAEPLELAAKAQRTDRFKQLKSEFIQRTGIPLEDINSHASSDDDGEPEPMDFKLDWLGPYAPVYCFVVAKEGNEDHLTLARAVQSRIKCAAYHIDYAAVPTREKTGYLRKLQKHLRSNATTLPDNGVILAVTVKEAFVRGVQGSEYLNIPKPVQFYANSILIPGSPQRLYFALNVARAKLHRPCFVRVAKSEVLQAAEVGTLTDFDFQDFGSKEA
jgi:hypothetical protein